MRWAPVAVAALAVAGTVTGLGYAAASADDGPGAAPLGPGPATVELTIRNSRFQPAQLEVWEGTQVRFVVRNEDPIGHELVVGDEELHRRHEGGTEAAHPPVPGEVSLPPLRTGATVVQLDDPGTVRMVCHLPRHEDYGMVGAIEVRERPG